MSTSETPEILSPSPRGQWGSRMGFILAAAGSAVGLGNIWKFPYITGENGGGLFVLIYLASIALVGIPIMAAEIMVGRAARKQPVGAFEALQGGKTGWSIVGWLGIIAGFIILSYYIVVAGWSMDYTLKSIVNFTDPIAERADTAAKAYRAATPLSEMRASLLDERVERRASGPIAELRSRATKATWNDWERYEAAVAAASDAATARAVLLEDADFAAHVHSAEALRAQISQARADALAEARAYFSTMSDRELRDRAETYSRRQHIAEEVGAAFGQVVSDGWTATFWALLFMLLTILVVAGGVSGGIERVTTVLMPMLVVVILIMVGYGIFQPGFSEAFSFVFSPDPSRLKASGVLEALGHAFFTLSLGMGAMITYGSYQKRKEPLFSQSLAIAGLDTAVALLACLMIFPIIFSYGQQPAAGPGLVFKSMPLAFTEMGAGGMLLGILFFALLVVAALTSAISLLEVVASYFIDQRGWSRRKAAWLIGGAIFLFAIPSAFSFDPDFAFESWEPTFGQTFFDTMDYLASNWLLPIGGLFVAIYAGWFMPKKMRAAELEGLSPALVKGWLLLIRWAAPALVTLVVLQKVGILSLD